MMKKIKFRLPLYACAALMLALFFILSGCGQVSGKSEEKRVVPVMAMSVERKDIQKTLDYVGDIKAEDEAAVYPKVSGKIIEKLKNEGDTVVKGDAIAYIDRDEVGFKFEKAPVESPMSGIIGRVYVDIGTQVNPQTPIALAVHMDNVKIDLDIPEQYLPKVSVGQTAQIYVQAYPEETFIGKVSRISPVLDLETRTAPIEIIIPNPKYSLKSGMFARVELVIEEHNSVPVILKEAVIGKDPANYVYVAEDGVARQKNVRLGIRQGVYYEVLEGLKQGDQVVVIGQQQLYDGAAVSIDNKGRAAVKGDK